MAKNYLKTFILSSVAFGALVSFESFAQQPSQADLNRMNSAAAQSAGEFDTMNLDYIHSLGMQQKAWNDPMQHLGEGQSKPGYSRYTWTPDVILPVRLREGMMTLINLPPWELIEKVHIGSPESFGGEIAAPNSLLVYADPTYIGVDSNLIIFGRSGNRYVFYLRSETYNTDRITHSVVDLLVGPKYTPASEGGQIGANKDGVSNRAASSGMMAGNTTGNNSAAKSGGKISSNSLLETIPVDPESFRFDIDVFIPDPADIEIAPERVWRDNIFTYIDLGPKVLTMTQRPIVKMLVQGSEVPVGFRTKGEHGRLIVVEGIGDMVLRNGQRIVCLKVRRDPSDDQYVDYSAYHKLKGTAAQPGSISNGMEQTQARVNGVSAQGQQAYGNNQAYAGGAYAGVSGDDMSPLRPLPKHVANSAHAVSGIVDVMSGMAPAEESFDLYDSDEGTIAIELGTDGEISKLEKLWDRVSVKNKDVLRGFEPYFSVDATADGAGQEAFRLRIGPVKKLEEADAVCEKLSKRGVICSVVRTQ